MGGRKREKEWHGEEIRNHENGIIALGELMCVGCRGQTSVILLALIN